MLKGDFYKVIDPITSSVTGHRCRIHFSEDHAIFKGHFPGLPVVPGVCMMAIVREMLEEITGRKLIMESTSAIKFLNMINPAINNEAEVEVKFSENDSGKIVADGVIANENIVFFKISKASYR